MNNYETLFVIKPTLTDEEMATEIAKTIEILEKEGADILAIDKMGMRKLAYPVNKYERGFYTIIYFNAPGSIIAEFERKMKFNEEIIKYMTIKYTKQKELAQFKKLIANATNSKVAEEEKEEVPQTEPTIEKEAPKEEEKQTEEATTTTDSSVEA
jgi:small subunit ribosomal protein S6